MRGMAAQTVAITLGILWTPPFATPNSGNSSFNLSAQYNAQNVGNIDVPGGTSATTPIPIPFGTVSQCRVLIIKNMMSSDIGIRFNGAVADNFQIAPGAMVSIFQPQSPVANNLASASIVTTAVPGTTETVSFWVFGD